MKLKRNEIFISTFHSCVVNTYICVFDKQVLELIDEAWEEGPKEVKRAVIPQSKIQPQQ